jgi:transposase InsO family protein
MTVSMSRKGNCYDSALMESFWGTLKNELIYLNRYATRQEAIREIKEYIEIFYNRQRNRLDSTTFLLWPLIANSLNNHKHHEPLGVYS